VPIAARAPAGLGLAPLTVELCAVEARVAEPPATLALDPTTPTLNLTTISR
jgi:hypothetical protein